MAAIFQVDFLWGRGVICLMGLSSCESEKNSVTFNLNNCCSFCAQSCAGNGHFIALSHILKQLNSRHGCLRIFGSFSRELAIRNRIAPTFDDHESSKSKHGWTAIPRNAPAGRPGKNDQLLQNCWHFGDFGACISMSENVPHTLADTCYIAIYYPDWMWLVQTHTDSYSIYYFHLFSICTVPRVDTWADKVSFKNCPGGTSSGSDGGDQSRNPSRDRCLSSLSTLWSSVATGVHGRCPPEKSEIHATWLRWRCFWAKVWPFVLSLGKLPLSGAILGMAGIGPNSWPSLPSTTAGPPFSWEVAVPCWWCCWTSLKSFQPV